MPHRIPLMQMSAVWTGLERARVRRTTGFGVLAWVTRATSANQDWCWFGLGFVPWRSTKPSVPGLPAAIAPYTVSPERAPRSTSFDHVLPWSFEYDSHADWWPACNPSPRTYSV